eukprot:1838772-Amphidinium_carterae.1
MVVRVGKKSFLILPRGANAYLLVVMVVDAIAKIWMGEVWGVLMVSRSDTITDRSQKLTYAQQHVGMDAQVWPCMIAIHIAAHGESISPPPPQKTPPSHLYSVTC